jgi:hypothetical protein
MEEGIKIVITLVLFVFSAFFIVGVRDAFRQSSHRRRVRH